MKPTVFHITCLLTPLILTGCLERQFAEETDSISVEKAELVVPADSDLGRNLVTDTIWVAANKSWTAQVQDGVDWMTCNLEGHRNLSLETDRVPLVLNFLDNEGDARIAKVLLFSEAGKQEVTVKQEKIAYRIAFGNTAEDLLDLSYEADSCILQIKSNTEWTIAVKEGSSIKATFSRTSGKYADEVKMYIEENPDMELLSGAVVLSSPNVAAPVELPVSQVKAKPYIKLPDGTTYTALDGIDNLVLPIKANTLWTATVESASGYDKSAVRIEPASGDKTTTQIKVIFPASYDFSKEKASIKIKLTAEGASSPAEATINQTPCLRCCFGDPYTDAIHQVYTAAKLYDKTKPEDIARIHSYWPFSKYESDDKAGGWIEHGDGFEWVTGGTRDANSTVRCTLKNSGYILYIGAGKGVNFTPDYLSIGKDNFVYFGCPIVPGRRLKKVELWIRVTGLGTGVLDLSGNLVDGGDLQISDKDPECNKIANLADTKPGVEYRIGYVKVGFWFRFSDVLFYYE